jgi:hypothetical protein
MTLQDIADLLAARTANGTLTLSPGDLGSTGIDSLLAANFSQGKLILQGATVQSDSSQIQLQGGTTTLFGAAAVPATAVFTLINKTPELVLTCTPPDYNFGIGFPVFADSALGAAVFSDAQFILSSSANGNGATFSGSYALPSALEAIAKLLKAPEAVAFTGALVWVEELPQITLTSTVFSGVQLGKITADMRLVFGAIVLPADSPTGRALAVPLFQLRSTVDITAVTGPKTVALTADLPVGGRCLVTVTAALDDVALTDLTGLATIVGDLGFPPDIPIASQFDLTELSLVLSPATAKIVGLSLQIRSASAWSIVPDHFSVETVWLNFIVNDPFESSRQVFVTVGGALTVNKSVEIDLSYGLPGNMLTAQLASGSTIPLSSILSGFLPDTDLPELSIVQLELGLDVVTHDFHFEIDIMEDWPVSAGGTSALSFTELSLFLSRSAGDVTARVLSNLTVAGAALQLSAGYQTGQGWNFAGGTRGEQNISLTNLLGDLLAIFGVALPTDLPDIVLTLLEMSYDTGTGAFTFDCEIGYVDESDPILQKLKGKIAIAYSGREAKTWTGHIEGTIEIGHDNLVTAKLDFKETETLSLQWKAENEKTVGIADLCALVEIPSEDIPDIPPDLDLALVELDGIYDITNKVVMLGVVSKTWGNADVVLSKNAEGKWDLFFALKTGKTISLSSLPLVGSPLSSVVGDVSLDDIQFYAAQPVLTKDRAGIIGGYIDRLSSISGASYPKPPPDGLSAKAALTMNFHVAGKTTPFSLGTGKPADDQGGKEPAPAKQFAISDAAPTGASSALAQTQTASGSDGTKWFTIQKSFGPVSIQKVGVRYQDSQLWALLDASLDAGGLTISLHGLGMGSGLKSFDPKFTVSGIDVTLVEGPIEASGGLIGTIDPVNLYGELMLKTPEFALGALAGFALVDKHPSFFLYATLLSPPLGGPAFFYVTGLAAGIGFNRQLVIPAVDGVSTFPFIEWAMGSGAPTSVPGGDVGQQVKDVLSSLASSGVVAPQVGEYWLAAGVHFTSFELVESFALLTVKFGADFELDLLGLSRLTLPPTGTPVVLIEIQLKASFSPSAGLLAISGQLSPRSYVLSESCHLTGGFAFYSWFSGEHEGDFVISMGGYHPRFDVPKHYPVVPRLGLRWQVTDQLTVSGDEYFALTSSAVMAGGGLSAVWDGGPVSAWFSVEMDFLLIYKPFHYYLSASCQLGASFSIDLLFTTITISIHLGVDIEIWGPEFTGVATVDLSIISFSIGFGGSNQDASQTIEWHEFLDQLLPKKPPPPTKTQQSHRMMRMAVAAETNAPPVAAAVVQIKMTDGLLKTLSETGEETLNYVVDSQHFKMEVTAIPSKEPDFVPKNTRPNFKAAPIDLPDKLQPTDEDGNIIQPNTVFGVGPVGIGSEPDAFKATLAVEIDSSADVKFHAVRILKNVSKAFWEKPGFSDDGKSVPKLDPLNDTTIKNVLVGFQIIPFVTPPDKTRPIDLEYLKYTVDEEHIESFRWSAPIIPGADNFSAETVVATLNDPNHAVKNRPPLLRAMKAAGFPVAQTIDAGDLGDPAKTYLEDAPVLALLGEAK